MNCATSLAKLIVYQYCSLNDDIHFYQSDHLIKIYPHDVSDGSK